MSKHFFKITSAANIVVVGECGYDRILNQYHLSLDSQAALEENAVPNEVEDALAYDSMMTPGGHISLHQLTVEMDKRGLELPHGLLFELQAEKEAGVRTNFFITWPLEHEAQQQNLDLRMMLAAINDQLKNNDTDDEQGVFELLQEQNLNIEDKKLRRIVATELPRLRKAFWEEVNWADYDLQPGHALVGLVPVTAPRA